MAAIGWGALFVFLFCMFSIGPAQEHEAIVTYAILALSVVAALVCFWAFARVSAGPSVRRPVSEYMGREPQKWDELTWANRKESE